MSQRAQDQFGFWTVRDGTDFNLHQDQNADSQEDEVGKHK